MTSIRLPPAAPAALASPHRDLARAVERLVIVLHEENAALKRMDFACAGRLLAAKYSAADTLEAAARAMMVEAKADGGTATLDRYLSCLSPLMTENQELHQRSARLQKRVYTLVERLAAHATGKRRSRAVPVQVAASH